MRSEFLTRRALLVAGFCGAMAAAGPAIAYMGPGAGLGMLSSLFAVLGVVLLALLGVILFPVRMLLKFIRKRSRSGGRRQGASSSGAPPGA
jgi:hypothetical protein